ncbi:Tn3 family transposase (plasmid) [Phormidium sp. CLA17]|nr:Tn3 family transposase [Leptolyngbya sp. Cla-17]
MVNSVVRLYVAKEQFPTLSIHSLRRFLMVARQGELRQRKQEDLANQSSCLTLVTK